MHVTWKSRRLMAASALVLATMVAGCSSTQFEPYSDDGEAENRSAESNAVKAIMTGLGAIDPTDKPIAYQPRAPLVMPPKRDLASPQDTDAQLASRNFPKDSDDRDRILGMCDTTKDMSAQAKKDCASLPKASAPTGPSTDTSRRLTVEEMKSGHSAARDSIMGTKEDGTPAERRTLSEPPTAYRTPSANAPFEEAKPKESSWKPSWWPL